MKFDTVKSAFLGGGTSLLVFFFLNVEKMAVHFELDLRAYCSKLRNSSVLLDTGGKLIIHKMFRSRLCKRDINVKLIIGKNFHYIFK